MSPTNGLEGVFANLTLSNPSESKNTQGHSPIQHTSFNSAVVAPEFFNSAPLELVNLVAAHLSTSSKDLFNFSHCNRHIYAMFNGADGVHTSAKLAKGKLPKLIASIQVRGFRPFNAEQKQHFALIARNAKWLGDPIAPKLRGEIEQALREAAINLRLSDLTGVPGKFDMALDGTDQWPTESTGPLGRANLNLKQLAWQAIAEDMATNNSILLISKAIMFDKLLAKDSQTTNTVDIATRMLEQLGNLSRKVDEQKRTVLESFFKENGKRPPCFAYIGLLSLVPAMESLERLTADPHAFAIPYMFCEIEAQAWKLGAEYGARIREIMLTNKTIIGQ